MASCVTPVIHVWCFYVYYMDRTCVLYLYLLTCITPVILHM